jgi:putative sigma-54 modulation protein
MNIDYVSRNFQLDDRVRRYTEEKLHKVGRFLDEPIDARVAFVTEKHRHTCEVHLTHRHGELRATQEGHDLQDLVNGVIEAIVEQAKRGRKKVKESRRRADREIEQLAHWPVDVVDRATLAKEGGPRVIETSTIPIKPMTIEEAAQQLDDSEQGFVVFRDATNQRVSVLYRRRDEHFGLVSPEF